MINTLQTTLVHTLRELVSHYESSERVAFKTDAGALHQRERIARAAALVCKETQGDLVEIGCLRGSTTIELARVAKQFERKVIAVDPWEIGTQNCEGGEYEHYLLTTQTHADYIETLRTRSDSDTARRHLQSRAIAFAFIDGLHTYRAALNDLRMLAHAQVIALDDVWQFAEVYDALEHFTDALPSQFSVIDQGEHLREVYLIRQ